jgi:SHS2 domain-containing protein
MYEVFAHTADIGLRVRAATLDDLFIDAAIGLFSLIVGNLDDVQLRDELKFSISGKDGEHDFLLFDWLNELLFTFDSRRVVLRKFDVHITPASVEAKAWGEPLDSTRHRLEHEVKAITYHGLRVVREHDGWLAEVIMDI